MASLRPDQPSPSRARSSLTDSSHGRVSLSRSPHPYHRRSSSLADKTAKPDLRGGKDPNPPQRSSSSDSSDSGTEADDERGSLLKGLPAPPLRVHKGLRGASPYAQSPVISPLPSPPLHQIDSRKSFFDQSKKQDNRLSIESEEKRHERDKYTRRKRAEIVRRFTETSLLLSIGALVHNGVDETNELRDWQAELFGFSLPILAIYLSFPFRRSTRFFRGGYPLLQSLRKGFHIPSKFDPGSLLYPVLLPYLVAASLLQNDSAFLLPNLILGLSSIPSKLIPASTIGIYWSYMQWAVSIIPLAIMKIAASAPFALEIRNEAMVNVEQLVLLCPLQKTLLPVLEYLTTTSLDPSELQLLATALINLLIFAISPQMQILKSLLWLGGLALFVSCLQVLRWEVALARIPAWKFARKKRSPGGLVANLDYHTCHLLAGTGSRKQGNESSDDEGAATSARKDVATLSKINLSAYVNGVATAITQRHTTASTEPHANGLLKTASWPQSTESKVLGSDTKDFGAFTRSRRFSTKRGSQGRAKRSMSPTSSSFLALSPAQAFVRKWIYAAYIYSAVLAIILLPIRRYVSIYALSSYEPFGWALGYLLGNFQELRFLIVSNNLEKWIVLPPRVGDTAIPAGLGWLERLRQTELGPAATRLLICAYCCAVLLIGIAIVLRLTSVVEVDTRRKVFHGIMVAMLLPTIFVDPAFIALALVLILAIFLLLDLFRASQLPPISKPLTHFLAPYVDGRDHRGPVIVSHIFLLTGCAIPLWLSMAGIDRVGVDPWVGWDVKDRNVSMTSGVVCVGMGDAAASLIGRRYGKTKWYWGGGKSLEGSLAFVLAVTVGLMSSYTWLRVGGWVSFEKSAFLLTFAKCLVAGTGASLMESTLTAANDNVVVPVGLWLLVGGLKI